MMRGWCHERLLAQPEPYHKVPEPYSCICVACDNWRAARVKVGSIVIGIKTKHCEGAPTWHPAGPFAWGDDHDSVNEPMLVISDMPGDSPGGHLDSVMLWSINKGFRITSRKWLLVISS